MMMTGSQAAGEAEGLSAGATRVYVCPQRDQLFLLPVCMCDWLEEGHLAWFVLDVVAELDTGGLHRRPGGCPGRPPYEPEMLVALLLYAYCCGVRSSRRIEAACRTDAAFRVICGGLVPDHATIARFVVDQERALEGLFVSGLRLCAAAGLADLSVVALDGTKIAADVSLARNRDGEWIRREVAKLMAVTGEDEQPAAAGPEGLPGVEAVAEISSPTGRLARLRAALEVIEAEDAAGPPPRPIGRPRRPLRPSVVASSEAASPKNRGPRSRAPRSTALWRPSGWRGCRPRASASSPRPSAEKRSRVRRRAGSSRPSARFSGQNSRSPRPARRSQRRPPRLLGRTSPIPTAGS